MRSESMPWRKVSAEGEDHVRTAVGVEAFVQIHFSVTKLPMNASAPHGSFDVRFVWLSMAFRLQRHTLVRHKVGKIGCMI